ncbi:MAG: serine/threonine-protein kinase [Anaerolineae bacterium]|nr:serine/threonine-protein kinase [Anaerolineae bacterium]
MTLERGDLLYDRYLILEILGQGGMGALYRAKDENLGLEVAVKENLFTTAEYARQFHREATILAKLRQTNLPRVSDHFVIDDQGQYLVMDYIEGEDLRERMDQAGVISEDVVVKIGIALCDALTYMHTQNPPVLHRDIKPGNVKITSNGQVFLVDFGLAKVAYSGQRTTTGARAMTPGYSPPEQYGGARTDNRSDIYSLAATLYAALAGTLPEDSLARTMQQIELTPLRDHNPNVSEFLAGAIEKALEAYPKDRFQDAESFKQAMLNDPDLAQSAKDLNNFDEAQDGVSQSPNQINAGEMQKSQTTDNISGSRFLNEDDFLLISKPRPARNRGCFRFLVFWIMIVFIGSGILYAIDPALFRQISNSVLPIAIDSSSQDSAVSQQNPSATHELDPTGSIEILPTLAATLTPVQPLPLASSELSTVTATVYETITATPMPTALGGGFGQIAFASDRTGLSQIWMVNVNGTELRQITHAQRGACQPSWSPTGAQLAYISPCKENLEIYTNTSIYIIDVDGSDATELPTSSGGDFDPAWSPDGRLIAFTSLQANGRAQIYVVQLATQKIIRLSEEYNIDINPSWSADSSQLLFITTRNGPYQIWTMNRDGSNQLRFSTSRDLKNSHPVWAFDGKEVLFTQRPVGGVPQLMAAYYPTGAMQEYRVYPQAGVTPMREANYSPDANWMAFESWPNGFQHDIYFLRANGDDLTQLTFDPGKDFDAAWRPQSR